ncbi:MAG: hypothetical protein JO257_22750 [Deltaproteobacteria bacterium]|nr:hypothetical protein [Deltaproteobacteria bacterium]
MRAADRPAPSIATGSAPSSTTDYPEAVTNGYAIAVATRLFHDSVRSGDALAAVVRRGDLVNAIARHRLDDALDEDVCALEVPEAAESEDACNG